MCLNSYATPMKTVLVAADDQWVVNDVEAGLCDQRVDVIVVSDPHALNAAALAHDPDLCIVDLQVGSMGGMALIRSLKAAASMGTLPSTPILLMVDRDADAFIAKRSGADGWIRKPFTAQELRAARDAVLSAS